MLLAPGYKTTELLVVVLVGIGSITASAADVLPAKWAALASSISVAAYAISRGIAKAGATLGTVPTATTPPPPAAVRTPEA